MSGIRLFLKERMQSFRFAGKGIFNLFRYEHNAQVHLLAIVSVTIVGLLCHLSANEWCAVCLCFGLVTAMECINTAVEKLCDYLQPNYDSRIGRIKDLAAGAVLLATLACIVTGLIIFLPKILSL